MRPNEDRERFGFISLRVYDRREQPGAIIPEGPLCAKMRLFCDGLTPPLREKGERKLPIETSYRRLSSSALLAVASI